jgi:hypothetical protein
VIWDSFDPEAQVVLVFAPSDKPVKGPALLWGKGVTAVVKGVRNKRYHYIAGLLRETACPTSKDVDVPAKACPSLEIRDPVIIIR